MATVWSTTHSREKDKINLQNSSLINSLGTLKINQTIIARTVWTGAN